MTKTDQYLKLVMESRFPLPSYPLDFLKKQYLKLSKKNIQKNSNTGLEIVKHFHPSIWRCNIKNHKSPIEAWNDPIIMTKVIENRFKYLKTKELSINNIAKGLSITKLAPKVSIFKPTYAKYLIEKYLNEFDTIFDPCSGLSGRLLGACILNKKYIGQDINSISVKESNGIISFLNLEAKVIIKDSIYDKGIYDCLFTCPPYSDKENWHQDIEILETDEWIDTVLKNYKCKKYLFVVDNTFKYKDYIVETADNRSHFGKNTEKIILIEKC